MRMSPEDGCRPGEGPPASVPGTDDRGLIERISRGDRDAFDQLVARHEGALFRFARRFLGDADAEDALQDALLAVWRSTAEWRGEASVRTWLFQIVTNACHRRMRRAPRDTAGAEGMEDVELAAPSPAPDSIAGAREVGRALEAALGSLEAEAREVLILRDVEGLSGDEVADVLHLSLPAMKSRLHRARLALKERVEAALGGPITEELS